MPQLKNEQFLPPRVAENLRARAASPQPKAGIPSRVAAAVKSQPPITNYQPSTFIPGTQAQGIDLSRWENTFNPAAATGRLDFVILKASEGYNYKDPNLESFYSSSRAVPIKGAYHYLRSQVSVASQVKMFLNAVGGKNFDFYAVDVESYGNIVNAQYAQQARDFISQVKAQSGVPVILYTNNDIYGRYFTRPTDRGLPLWISWPSTQAQKPFIAGGAPSSYIWQKSFGAPAKSFGVTGAQGIDYNVFSGTMEDMKRWLASLGGR